MRLLQIWRHPVKSLQGERLKTANVEQSGIAGDRGWGIRDGLTGKILTGRREPALLMARSHLEEYGEPVITLPDGTVHVGLGPRTDEALSAWLGRRVTLVDAASRRAAKAEYFADATDDTSATLEWTMPEGRFVDAFPLLVLTTASLRAGRALHPNGVWDVRRFRPNLLIDADGDDCIEDAWIGGALRIGGAVVRIRQACTRCTMVTRPQPGFHRDLDVYRVLARHHDGTFGTWASVPSPGVVRVGDEVEVVT